ncbi:MULTISPECIES: recombinase family protein [unclassified Chelatococcus]|uniref:recombinase family protein n=1 Tax=unclassified Chelatococcus TaxID=2638111 RepID=UPI001BCBC40E|nr:recombinase family protein [Chelatococcus sp.]MBS7698675.1 recombinase family protein [Chelatococcus sp. YT9]MBX3554743.1 recombinase family protein [Chelatococcus sp.]
MTGTTTTHARAVTYSRFSTELQTERSIEDQQALCREYASKNGLTVVAEYADRARSGGSVIGRDGLFAMMEAARAGQFDVLVVEALDRISRDMEDLSAIHKRLTFAGVDILAVHDGRADTVTVGLRGLVGQLYREDNARKVRRGMSGVIRDGRNAGGRSYGYRPVSGKPGELQIVEEEAEVIRRIFALYRDGISPRAIAGMLNDEDVPPPRGARWNSSTINGNTKRGNGIIQNPIYQGRLIWNRVRMVRDPETGRRVSRVNPEAEWQTADVPHLRIVDEATAAVATDRKKKRGWAHGQPTPKNARFLSGLLRCAECGGGLAAAGPDRGGPRVFCSTHKESRTCTNSRRYYIEKIERPVLDALRAALFDLALGPTFEAAYAAEYRRVGFAPKRAEAELDREIADIKAAIARLVKVVAAGAMSDEDVAAEMADLRRRRASAEAAKSKRGSGAATMKPPATDPTQQRYAESLRSLDQLIHAPGTVNEVIVQRIRDLVGSVIVHRTVAYQPYRIEVKGSLARYME